MNVERQVVLDRALVWVVVSVDLTVFCASHLSVEDLNASTI